MTDIFAEVEIEPVDQNVDYLQELVGDGKKFKTPAELAKGKAEADRYIAHLTSRMDELRDELKTSKNMEQILTEIRSTKTVPNSEPPVVTPDGQKVPEESDLETRLEKIIAEREAKKNAESNMTRVQQQLTEAYGDQANLVINQKARELNMTVTDLKSLAVRSPEAFSKLVGIEAPKTPDSFVAPRSTVNSSGQISHSSVRNKSFYDKMKQSDPIRYHSQQTTVDMIRDATNLGDRFYS